MTRKSLKIAVAESCTGGNLSALLTQDAGASTYFDCGFITYSNQAKIKMLGVDAQILSAFGAVSEQTARAMVSGVMARSSADIGVAITGIAGPAGGTQKKPVGTVCFGFYLLDNCFTNTQYFSGDRGQVVAQSVAFVVETLVKRLSNQEL